MRIHLVECENETSARDAILERSGWVLSKNNLFPNAVSMKGQRRRLWVNIKTTLGQHRVFAGWSSTQTTSVLWLVCRQRQTLNPNHTTVKPHSYYCKLDIVFVWGNYAQFDYFKTIWKGNEWGFSPRLCTHGLNWARRTSWGWWDEWDDTDLQTQDSKIESWRSEAELATSRSLHETTHNIKSRSFIVKRLFVFAISPQNNENK